MIVVINCPQDMEAFMIQCLENFDPGLASKALRDAIKRAAADEATQQKFEGERVF